MEESSNRNGSRVIHDLIDVSSEDDSLISSSSSSGNNNNNNNNQEELPSRQPERSRKCNLRKSLAWDKAFFTNAGVLEPEELSIINSGLNKSSSSSLSRIQEDVLRTSADSTSTFDSSLENLEAALFDDIRASIQFSSPSPQSSRKVDPVSLKNNKIKNQTINTQGAKVAQKNKREPLVRPRPQVTAKSGELKQSLLRPPKMAGKMNPVTVSPTKKASLGIKSEIRNGKSIIGKKEEAKKSLSSSVSGIKMESAASCSDSLRKKTNVSSLKPPLRSSVHVMKSVSKLSPSVSAASSQDSLSSSSSSTNQHPIRKVLPNPSPKRNSADFKPTGLRMPSPKIGYFDAEKSTQVRSGLPKHGVGGRVTTSKIGSGVRKTPSRSLEVASATKTIPVTAEGQREKENSRCYENQVDTIDSKAGELTARKQTTVSSQDDLFLSTDDTRMRTPLAVKCNETEDSSTADQPVSASVQSDET